MSNSYVEIMAPKKVLLSMEDMVKNWEWNSHPLKKKFSQHLSPSLLACLLSLTKQPLFDATSSGSLRAPVPVLQTFSLYLLSCATSFLPLHWRQKVHPNNDSYLSTTQHHILEDDNIQVFSWLLNSMLIQNPKHHDHFHIHPSLDPILSQMNQIHTLIWLTLRFI